MSTVDQFGRSKIGDFQDVVFGDENVGRFQIAMNEFIRMQIVHAIGNLSSPVQHLRWFRAGALLSPSTQHIVQRTVGTIFHHNVKERGRNGNSFEKIQSIGMFFSSNNLDENLPRNLTMFT